MESLALRLARWATTYRPSDDDLALADLALTDTVSVALAARGEPILAIAADLPAVERWAVAAHILDFDDLHLPSTSHISTICVPVALACGGSAATYLVGAGVMARLGGILGHPHYSRGWHATATVGTVAAAAAAAVARGLDADGVVRAMALAVPSAGGVQRAFGTDGKSLQVGLAAGAGVRAAALAARGASADPSAVDAWVELLGGDPTDAFDAAPAVPDGLAIKLYPCCYALQRPIGTVAEIVRTATGASAAGRRLASDEIHRVVVRTPASTLRPLIHAEPATGLEGKFSLEYAVAAAVLDGYPGLASFTDEAVQRPAAQRLVTLVEVDPEEGGAGLLAGEVDIELTTATGTTRAAMSLPPGSPGNPATASDLAAKFDACLAPDGLSVDDITWASAPRLLDAVWASSDAPMSTERRGCHHG